MSDPTAPIVDPQLCFQMALQAHRAGDDVAAQCQYAAIPRMHPLHADALHGLGMLALQRNVPLDAEVLIRESLRIKPGLVNGEFHLGQALAAQHRWTEAVAQLQLAVTRCPHDAVAWNTLGHALLLARQIGEALIAYQRALKYDRRNPIFFCGLADALRAHDRLDEARAAYEKALAGDPNCTVALTNLGALLVEQRDFAVALPLLERAVTLSPDGAEALNTLGIGYRGLGRDHEAVDVLRRATTLQPQLASAWNSLSAALLDTGDSAGAEQSARRALELDTSYANAWMSLGNILKRTARLEEARSAYSEALRIVPEAPTAHWNLALLDLLGGDFDAGFRGFEWRLRLPGTNGIPPDLDVPLWQGEDLKGKRLLVYAEQGLGDTLQFARYIPLLAGRGAQVFICCAANLHRLLGRLPGCTAVTAPDTTPPDVDYCCPMLSLPYRFGTTLATIPGPGPYLTADPVRVAEWAQRFAALPPALRVGIVWAGESRPDDPEAHRIDRRRSLPLEMLAPLFGVKGVNWFSLQKGMPSAQLRHGDWEAPITDWTNDLQTFDDTAALLSQLDLVISVDTSVVHLAAAMGKPVWVLSRFDGCWRWLFGRSDSPWYASVRLFRQKGPDDWVPVIAALRAALIVAIASGD
jgi:Flp pilus assembly protein TadD